MEDNVTKSTEFVKMSRKISTVKRKVMDNCGVNQKWKLYNFSWKNWAMEKLKQIFKIMSSLLKIFKNIVLQNSSFWRNRNETRH